MGVEQLPRRSYSATRLVADLRERDNAIRIGLEGDIVSKIIPSEVLGTFKRVSL
jgi:hypothetical protein